MKLKTNLTATELELVSKGLKRLAQHTNEITPENSAEAEISRKLDGLFDTMVNSLQDEFSRVLLEKDV